MLELTDISSTQNNTTKDTILVVEDDPGVSILERRRLERAGYAVVCATSAEEALEYVEQGVTLIVLDQGLPDATGLEFHERLKASGYDLPIIMVTGLSDEATVVAALRAGVCDYVNKSSNYLDYLPKAVEQVLREVRLEQRLRESEEKYHSIFENAVEGIYQASLDGRLLTANLALARMFGYSSPEEMLSVVTDTRMQLWVSGEEWERYICFLQEGGTVVGAEAWMKHKNGSTILVSLNMRLLRNADGKVVALEGSFQDITERRRMEEMLRQSAAALSEAQRMAHLGSWEWDLKTGEVWWSEETYRIYGFEPGTFVPSLEKIEEVFHPDDRYIIRMAIDKAYSEAKPYDFEHRIVRPNGEVRWVHRHAEVVRGPDGEPLRLIGTSHDVTERTSLEERLEHQAFHDDLTGLPNRRLFVDRLNQALKRTLRRGGKVAVLFLDLDSFKSVNDSLGHDAGDRLLMMVTERLKGCFRPEDTFARFGGDEFTVLIEDMEGSGEAVRVTERIIAQFRTPFLLEGQEQFISASIGIDLGDALAKTSEDLLRGADTAMYRAKEERSGYRVFEPSMHERAVARLSLENDLRKAIEAGAGEEFVLHYQPIVDLRSGGTQGVEALVRWEHPRRGLLEPLEFIPLAEDTDLIVPLGRWIMEEACRQAREWNERRPGLSALVVSVNVSARQLRRPELAETIEGALRQSGLEPELLILEVTESAVLEAGAEDKEVLDRLRSLRVRLAIDDFGTGYSSLSYLKRFPADVLKIDKSFVWNLGRDNEDMAIAQMIVDLAHGLGMEVIGEEVEDAGTEMLLREMGCDFAQGFYFSKPVPPDEIEGVLDKLTVCLGT